MTHCFPVLAAQTNEQNWAPGSVGDPISKNKERNHRTRYWKSTSGSTYLCKSKHAHIFAQIHIYHTWTGFSITNNIFLKL